MNIFRHLMNYVTRSPTTTKHELIVERGNGFYGWNGQMYKSDIIRGCIRPFARSIGKLGAKQIREGPDGLKVNPDRYVKLILEEPNPLITGQMLQQKLAVQLALNNNAFALIIRDGAGYANQIYPIEALSVEALYDANMTLYLRFCLKSGKMGTFPYSDIIHLREDFNDNDIFGDGNIEALRDVMDVAATIDKSLVDAVKNSAVNKWLLKWSSVLRPEDIKKETENFVKTYLSSEGSVGAIGVDSKAEAIQITPHDYVPNAVQWDRAITRIHSYYNTNQKIIDSTYNEDEWNAYYESVIEPVALQMSNEFTRKIFSPRERGYGNRIIFESMSLQYASMSTKLNLLQMVDRGALTPNEWRRVLNMAPIDGGDQAVRRLDTAPTTNTGGGEGK